MFMRFLLVGGLGFCIDAGATYLLIQLTIAPWLARIPAIALAMAFTWLANRYFTYKVNNPRSASEAMRYVMVAIFMALFNYTVYLVLVNRGLSPVVSITLATACQTVISFHAYRYFVFNAPSQEMGATASRNTKPCLRNRGRLSGWRPWFMALLLIWPQWLF